MTNYISKLTLKVLQENKLIKDGELEIYEFGLQLLISTLLKTMALIVLALISGLLKETIVFSLCFGCLRIQAGGYHARSIGACFFTTILIFFSSIILVRLLPAAYNVAYIIIGGVISSTLVILLAPIENHKRPLSLGEKRKYRRTSLITVLGGNSIILGLAFLKTDLSYICTIASTGFLLESLSLIDIKWRDEK